MITMSTLSMSVGSDSDDDNYKPAISSPSSVIMLSVGIVALLLSIFVATSIHHYGTKSASSKLVFMMNCAQGTAIFSKLPFIFNSFPHGCKISQILLIYSFTQLWLVSYMMLLCTNHLKLDMKSTIYSSSDLGLNKRYKLFLYLFPVVPIIFPLVTDSFEERYNWCVTEPHVHNGSWILAQAVLFMIIIWGLMGRQTWVIYKQAKKLSHMMPTRIVLKRILKGPFVYAFITIVFGFVGVILIRGSSNNMDVSSKKSYFVNYAIVFLFFVPAYFNFLIFLIEKRHLMMFESHVAEVKEFENGFDFEEWSDDEENDTIEDDRSDAGSLRYSHSPAKDRNTIGSGGRRSDLNTPLFDFEANGF